MSDKTDGFAVLDAATGTEARLAMEGLWLTGRILPVGARLVVVHTFCSAEAKPLEVVYAFGLPRDAALRRFKVLGDGFQVRSELKPVQQAHADYEQGLSEGHLAALARTYRDGRVNLSLGNLRPGEMVKVFLELVAGVDLRDDGVRFRFPFTLAPCYHRHARAIEVEPGVGELELPEGEFGDLLLPRYLTDPASLHGVGFDLSVGAGGPIATVASPSHAVRVTGLGAKTVRVTLSRERDVPDRDLVLDVQTSGSEPRCCGGVCPGGKARFTAVVPSTQFGPPAATPKSVVFILDRSGSMEGTPIEQAKRAVEACVGTLSERDRLGFIAFDDRVELFQPGLVEGTVAHRDALRQFLATIGARGGTELAPAIQAGIQLAGAANAELFVVTDGQVAATEDILKLSRGTGARIHCLGIGAASQDRFLTLLARETGGVSRFVTPHERVDMAALELFAGIGRPVASNVAVSFSGLPECREVLKAPTLVYEGHPLVVMGEADGVADGTLRITWGQGEAVRQLQAELPLPGCQDGETVRLLQGARLITDIESRISGERPMIPPPKLQEREERRITEKLEALSRDYGLASRAMALVAVVERAGDDASQVPTTRVVPVGMPVGTSFEAYFGAKGFGAHTRMCLCSEPSDMVVRAAPPILGRSIKRGIVPRFLDKLVSRVVPEKILAEAAPPAGDAQDHLLVWAAQLQPDGGLPGKSDEDRCWRSVVLLAAFLVSGSTANRGPFRLHIQRLAAFLKSALPGVAPAERRQWVEQILARAEAGAPLNAESPERLLEMLDSKQKPGDKDWLELARQVAPTP